MKTHPQNISESEDLRPVNKVNKRSKTGGNSKRIPVDLIFEIFLRLPAKSIARCRCLSKQCASILRLPYFTELFLTRSLARPQLLFACKKNEHVFFFTSHMPQSLDENSSLLTAKYYRMKIPYKISSDIRFSSIRGLVFVRIWRGRHVSVICNPSTGQSLILPKVKSRSNIGVRSYFGYDPVEKQYKVLSMIGELRESRWHISGEHQVLTLGESSSWRKIKRSKSYILGYKNHHICINGVLYCRAETSLGYFIIVCFDVRLEKFKFVNDINPYTQPFRCATLINYNGKLASLGPKGTIDGRCTSIKLRVLEDVKKQEWSEHIYVLPDLWKDIVGDTTVRFVGVTRTNEIVMCSSALRCLLYYNTQRNTIIRVEIRGMEAVKYSQIFTLHDHVEDVKRREWF